MPLPLILPTNTLGWNLCSCRIVIKELGVTSKTSMLFLVLMRIGEAPPPPLLPLLILESGLILAIYIIFPPKVPLSLGTIVGKA